MNKASTAQRPVEPARRIAVVNVPVAKGNPYQGLLYSDTASPFAFQSGAKDGFEALATNAALDDGPRLLHLHWDDRLFARTKDIEQNRAASAQALENLATFKAHGGRILWTVHNRNPHRARDLNGFADTRRAISDISDLIHVHAPHAATYLQQAFGTDPAKIRVIPHPSYLGAYEEAETTLNRPLAEIDPMTFLFFGMFRGNKGVSALHGAVRKLALHDRKFTLRLYGKAFASQARLLRRIGWVNNIDLRTNRIPDTEIPEIFGSSHVFVAPYSELFTSGTIMLAQTFGLPVIGPDIEEMRQTVPEECYDLLYSPDAPRGLIRKLSEVIDMDAATLQPYRTACLDFARERAPVQISGQIAQALTEIHSKEPT
jgi:beta-1,4-mannosyltransferase